jgi:surface protein
MKVAKRKRRNPVIVQRQSFLLPDDLLFPILSYCDVKTLIEKKQVCRSWYDTCTNAVNAKQQTSTTKKAFSTQEELRHAVKQYCGYHQITNSYSGTCHPHEAEEIAQTYGYPINKWDVSKLHDLEYIFLNVNTFNEDISSWNVSKATTMKQMFSRATTFNQDLSSWNVSNVTNMSMMFDVADAFNNNSISHWDVSNVTNMTAMFRLAKSFNQDLSFWNVQKVTNMHEMFERAYAFNQNLSCWNVSNVDDMRGMFRDATEFDQSIDESWELWDSSKLRWW